MNIFKKAFTLAEVIVVIALLGTIAALTVPSAIKNTTQKGNRIKIKKAMAVYDEALSKWYINGENLKYSNESIAANVLDPNNELANYQINSPAYRAKRKELIQERTARKDAVKSNYTLKFSNNFNTIRKDPNNPSIFQTKDGLWWNLIDTDKFFRVVVAFKEEDATEAIAIAPNTRAFIFTAEMPSYANTPITNKKTEEYPSLSLGKAERQEVMRALVETPTDSNTVKNINKSFSSTKLHAYINNNSVNSNSLSYFCTSSNCCQNVKGLCAKTDTWDNNNLRKQIYVYRDGIQVYTAYGYNPKDGSFYWEIYNTDNGGHCMEYRNGYSEGDCSSKTPSFK